MHRKPFNVAHGAAQAEQQTTNHRTDDVAAFIAAHGITYCPAGKRTPGLKKPVSAKRQRLDSVSWELRRAWMRMGKARTDFDGWMKRGRFK